MSILMDCEDLNEWSLFGGQLELVNIDSGNQTMTDSWSESAPDSSEMASVDIDDIGIMSSLKVVSCPADDVGEFVDCLKERDSVWNGADEIILRRSADKSSSAYEHFGAHQNASICSTRVNLPVIIKQAMGEANSGEVASASFVIDNSFVDESIIECVETEAAALDEFIDIELPHVQAAIYSDNIACVSIQPSNPLEVDDCQSPSDDDNDSALSVGSIHDLESYGFSRSDGRCSSDRYVERRLRKKEQNKTAALRYRMKKRIERGSVQSEYDTLMTHNIELKNKVEQMLREVAYLKELIAEMR